MLFWADPGAEGTTKPSLSFVGRPGASFRDSAAPDGCKDAELGVQFMLRAVSDKRPAQESPRKRHGDSGRKQNAKKSGEDEQTAIV